MGAAKKQNYILISLNSHCPEQDHDEKASSPSCFCKLERNEMDTTCVKEHPRCKPQKLLQAEAENPLLVPSQSCLLFQTMVVQKPSYCKIPGIGRRALRQFFFPVINLWWYHLIIPAQSPIFLIRVPMRVFCR